MATQSSGKSELDKLREYVDKELAKLHKEITGQDERPVTEDKKEDKDNG